MYAETLRKLYESYTPAWILDNLHKGLEKNFPEYKLDNDVLDRLEGYKSFIRKNYKDTQKLMLWIEENIK